MQANWLYSRAENVNEATHLLIVSRDLNEETIPFKNMNQTVLPFLDEVTSLKKSLFMFEYRFLKFKFDAENNHYQPIKFNCEQSFETLLTKYKDPESCYTANQRHYNRILYGNCEVDVP